MDAVRRLLENALTVTDERRVREDIEAALSLLDENERVRKRETGEPRVDEPGTRPLDASEETD